jgi:hypothetical protein
LLLIALALPSSERIISVLLAKLMQKQKTGPRLLFLFGYQKDDEKFYNRFLEANLIYVNLRQNTEQ